MLPWCKPPLTERSALLVTLLVLSWLQINPRRPCHYPSTLFACTVRCLALQLLMLPILWAPLCTVSQLMRLLQSAAAFAIIVLSDVTCLKTCVQAAAQVTDLVVL